MLIPLITYGQNASNNDLDYRLRETVNDLVVKANYGPKSYDEMAVEGSQYFNENFVDGKVFLNDKQSDRLYKLRYNALIDVIEVQNSNIIEYLFKHPRVSCLIGDDQIFYLRFTTNDIELHGYMNLIYQGSNYKVFVRNTKILREAKHATTSLTQSWPAKLIDDKGFYFLRNTEEVAFELKKKTLIDDSEEENKKIIKFIKSRKLDLDNEEDIIEIYKYYDSTVNSKK